MQKSIGLKLILLTPVFFLLAHYLAVFPHEYAHSTMAWLLGYKANPLNITYGGTSWSNILMLVNIDENVDYRTMLAQGHGAYGALSAFAGPGIANGLLYFLSVYLLTRKSIQAKPYWFYFIWWFNVMNLGNFYDYVPMRTFAPTDDMANLATGLNISPWWIYVVLGYLVLWVFWYFFARTMIQAYKSLCLSRTFSQTMLLVISIFVLFILFGHTGYYHGEISHFLSVTSFIMAPAVLIACWPAREWVKLRLQKISG